MLSFSTTVIDDDALITNFDSFISIQHFTSQKSPSAPSLFGLFKRRYGIAYLILQDTEVLEVK